MTSVHIITSGCSGNQANSEQMAGLLQEAKFKPVETVEDADVVIFNTCTLKAPAEKLIFSQLEQFKKDFPYKITVLAGCFSSADKQKLKEYSLVGIRQIHNIVQVVEEALHDNALQLTSNDEMPPLNLPRVRKNPFLEILPINRGCLNTYASAKNKKMPASLVSYPVAEIVEAAKKAVSQGVKEIWLTSQDTFGYGLDLGTDLAVLLDQLVNIPGDFKIKVGTGNPNHMSKISTKLVELYKNPKLFKYLHLPLQAGHDQTLKAMRQQFTVEEYLQTINLFKREIPEINLITDITVGYPTETEEHYWGTLEVVRKITPDHINISRFSASPENPAADLPELPEEVINHRAKVLTDIFQNVSKLRNERWLDWKGEITIEQKGTEAGQWLGRNNSFKQVIIEGNYKIGDTIKIIITRAETFGLRGKAIFEGAVKS